MKLVPLYDRVIVRPFEVEAKSEGGIVLTGSATEKSTRGIVIGFTDAQSCLHLIKVAFISIKIDVGQIIDMLIFYLSDALQNFS